MTAPPLPLRNDAEWDTCAHAYPAELCPGWDGPHLDLPPSLPDSAYDAFRLRMEAALLDVVLRPQVFVQVQP
ncbi:hypothetical protein [Curtobacterium sp. VKM Ac-2884]|uniref:hypothetical protein n=1 Tax=Curtobacterium sp. VKM Ac-2884 TaxID=2783818 RepID=UPI00188D1AFD|nr:hypothetical protein [Curtobacterium sp. VKM Ac-2884]MBF4602821.1 hypothetical protein [Curtobacterium sp. VKM Ac-2884]